VAGGARTSRYEPELEYFRFRRSRLLFGDFALTGRLDNTARGSCGLSDAPTAHVSTEVEAGKRGGQATEKYMRSALLVALLALSSQVAYAREIRRDAIPEAFRGTWTTSTDVCKDGDKSPIVLSAKSYASPAGSCVVDYVTEIPGRGGAIYSARNALLRLGAADRNDCQSDHSTRRRRADLALPGVREPRGASPLSRRRATEINTVGALVRYRERTHAPDDAEPGPRPGWAE
jgi:hypothetical protein